MKFPPAPSALISTLVLIVLAAGSVSAQRGGVVPHTASLASVQHIVVLFQENHSFDNYFGTYPHALNPAGQPKFAAKAGTPIVNGLANAPKPNPNLYKPWRIDRTKAFQCNSSHKYTAEQQAAHGGALDKFVEYTGPATPTSACPRKTPMGYYDGNTVTALWNYAQRFAMSDNTFGTTYGPSTPGAINLVSGQAHGATMTDEPLTTAVLNGTLIGDPDPAYDDCSGATNRAYLSGTNVGDRLTAANVTWGWFEGGFKRTSYTAGKAVCATSHRNSAGKLEEDYEAHHEPFQYYASTSNPHHLPPTSTVTIGTNADQANHQYDLSSFWAAAANHTLPAVSFIKAPAYQDGHPGSSDPLAEQTFIVNTLNRIQQLPEWSRTVVILAYDDSGGWYDHVYHAPVNPSASSADALNGPGKCGGTPVAGAYLDRCGYGPRLPLLVISPWSRVNFVDHSLNDQTSILRLIELRFGLPPIGDNSFDALNPAGSGSLLGMLNFSVAPRTTPLLLTPSTGLPASAGQPSGTSSSPGAAIALPATMPRSRAIASR